MQMQYNKINLNDESVDMARYKKSAEMRKNIMRTMQELGLQHGYSAVNIKDVADTLGVPRSLLYYYFKNKEDIMHALYDEWFFALDHLIADAPIPEDQPLVRMMLKHIIFHRIIATNPLFTEFILMYPDYASSGSVIAGQRAEYYYSDSYQAFRFYGKETDGDAFRIHVLMTDAVSRALIQGEYYKTISLSERKLLEHFGKHTVMISFDLDNETFSSILDMAFALADELDTSVLDDSMNVLS